MDLSLFYDDWCLINFLFLSVSPFPSFWCLLTDLFCFVQGIQMLCDAPKTDLTVHVYVCVCFNTQIIEVLVTPGYNPWMLLSPPAVPSTALMGESSVTYFSWIKILACTCILYMLSKCYFSFFFILISRISFTEYDADRLTQLQLSWIKIFWRTLVIEVHWTVKSQIKLK